MSDEKGHTFKVTNLVKTVQDTKYTLQTDFGTVYANKIYTTTLCINKKE